MGAVLDSVANWWILGRFCHWSRELRSLWWTLQLLDSAARIE